jgi:hypothetical protein
MVCNDIPQVIYHGFKPDENSDKYQKQAYKQLAFCTKMYLYDNRNHQTNKNQIDDDEIPDDDDKFWWALSRKFVWSEVNALLTKMDKLNIDFTKDLKDIRDQVLLCIEKKMAKQIFFAKLLKRLNYFVNNFDNNGVESSSDNSGSDNSDNDNSDNDNSDNDNSSSE